MEHDVIDLGFGVERTFRVRINWDELIHDGQEPTAGDVFAYLLDRLGPNDCRRCIGEIVQHRLQGALTELFLTPASEVVPEAPLESLIPVQYRRQYWRQLATALDLPLPPLRRPAWMERFIAFPWALVALLLPFAPFLVGVLAQNPTVRWLLIGFVAGAALRSGLLHFLTLPFAIRFPPGCDTVEGLVDFLLREHYGLLVQRERMWNTAEVWRILQAILADSVGVEPERVTPTTRLVSDLGTN